MAWQNPKTNWVAGDIPGAGDFNRSEGNAEYLKEQVDGVKTRLGRNEGDTQYLKEQTDELKRLGYAIRIAGAAQAGTSYTDTDYYFKWRSAYAVGKKVYFEANAYMPNPQWNERSYVQLYNYTTGTTIVVISINTGIFHNIVTSPAISIPDGAIIGVRLMRESAGAVYMKGAWLVIL